MEEGFAASVAGVRGQRLAEGRMVEFVGAIEASSEGCCESL